MLYEVFPNLFHVVLCLMLASLDPVKTLFFLLLSTYNAVLHFSYLGICLLPSTSKCILKPLILLRIMALKARFQIDMY